MPSVCLFGTEPELATLVRPNLAFHSFLSCILACLAQLTPIMGKPFSCNWKLTWLNFLWISVAEILKLLLGRINFVRIFFTVFFPPFLFHFLHFKEKLVISSWYFDKLVSYSCSKCKILHQKVLLFLCYCYEQYCLSPQFCQIKAVHVHACTDYCSPA